MVFCFHELGNMLHSYGDLYYQISIHLFSSLSNELECYSYKYLLQPLLGIHYYTTYHNHECRVLTAVTPKWPYAAAEIYCTLTA